jgi:penicillin-binding protein 1A
VRLDKPFQLPQTSVLLTSNGALYGPVFEQEQRISVPLAEIAPRMLQAVVAVEDRRFYSHPGVDLRAIARALYVNVLRRRLVQGGSTITQQLARSAILRRRDRTLRRKILEAATALVLERHFTKRQILEGYLNTAYFGHNIYGVELAALTLCGKRASELDDSDAAYLAGLLRAPASYCHCCNPARAVDRTVFVLRLMGTDDHRAPALGKWQARPSGRARFPLTGEYVTEEAKRWLRQWFPEDYPFKRLVVRTTIDPACQGAVEHTCSGVRRLGYEGRLAIVVQDAASGAIRAIAGGSDFSRHPYNSASLGRLQPGSLLKPFILLAALQAGVSPDQRYLSQPVELRLPNGRIWMVRNFEERYLGWLTLEDALVHSDNTVYARLMLDVGLPAVRRILAHAGISAHLLTPAVSAGAIRPGVSPLQLCTAYSVFSTSGRFFPASLFDRVRHESGSEVVGPNHGSTSICTSDVANRITEILRRVNEEGTGILPRRQPDLAAKTGTSVSGGWHLAFDDNLRVLTWTESDFLPVGARPNAGKAVSAKALASRLWQLLRTPRLGFAELLGAFAGVDEMSVRDLLWVERQFQQT